MENKKTRRIGTRLAVFGCALALVTMAGVGMTFAKYTKTETLSNTGTVAAFGTTLSQDGKIFKGTYKGTSYTPTGESDPTDITVNDKDSSTTGLTLAPGTTNSAEAKTFSYTIGANEVAVKVDFSITTSNSGWTIGNGVAYEPVVFTITKTVGSTPEYLTFVAGDSTANPQTVDHLAWTSTPSTLTLSQLDLDFSETAYYAPQTASTTVTYTTTWAWAFDNHATPATYKVTAAAGISASDYTSGAGTTFAENDIISVATYNSLNQAGQAKCAIAMYGDEADTIIGTAAAATITYASELTATQID